MTGDNDDFLDKPSHGLTRDKVLEYLEKHPQQTNKREIARGLGVKGSGRVALRQILKQLEADGSVARVGKRAFASVDTPPPTGVVQFEKLDADGELFGRAVGKDGLYGPEILFSGFSASRRGKAPGKGDRALCRVEKGKDGVWRAS